MTRSTTLRMRLMAGVGLCGLLWGCPVDPTAPITTTTGKLISYFQAKDDLAATLQQTLGGTQGSASYRLIAINGPAYPVGALVSIDNPLDLESRDCVLSDGELPDAEAWSTMPSWSSNSSLDFGLGIPAMFRGAFLKAESSVDAGLKLDRTGNYGINDLSQVFMSRQELRRALESPGCSEALKDAEDSKAIFVRGIVYGRESLTSSRSFSGGVDAKVIEEPSGQFRLSYDRSGAFELSDDDALPKFAIVAEVATPDPSKYGTAGYGTGEEDMLADLFTTPSDEAIAKLNAVGRD